MSKGTTPSEYRIEVVARRLDGVVVDPSLVLINAANRISYDVRCVDHGTAFFCTSMIPKDRVVSPSGEQVDIQAASVRARGWVAMQATGPELRISEGIVFGACG